MIYWKNILKTLKSKKIKFALDSKSKFDSKKLSVRSQKAGSYFIKKSKIR